MPPQRCISLRYSVIIGSSRLGCTWDAPFRFLAQSCPISPGLAQHLVSGYLCSAAAAGSSCSQARHLLQRPAAHASGATLHRPRRRGNHNTPRRQLVLESIRLVRAWLVSNMLFHIMRIYQETLFRTTRLSCARALSSQCIGGSRTLPQWADGRRSINAYQRLVLLFTIL